jgi:predicted MFS family arabinose efflux permease
MTALLLAFGVASGLGVAVAGRAGRRTGAALAIAAALTAASLLALVVVDVGAGVGFAVVTLWGFVSGALPPLAQTEILRLAGRTHRTTAGALIPVLFNGGIAVGAALAALLVARFGLPALPVPASVVAGAAAIGLAACAACWPPRISR